MKLIEEQLSLLEMPPSQQSKVRVVAKWQRPPAGWSMVNTDGSLNCRTGEAGSGYVIRNDLAEFVEAGCRKHGYVDDPLLRELLACRDGLEAAVRPGFPKLIIQTDCTSVVDMWTEEKEPRFLGAHIIKEMKLLCNSFQEVKLLHIGREENKAAHCCAREALSGVSSIRFDVTPRFLTEVIQSECNLCPV
jgi:ribonuclease HI